MSDSEYESESDNSVSSVPKPASHKYAKNATAVSKKVPESKPVDSDEEDESVATDDDNVSVNLDASDDEDEEIDENELYNTGTAKSNADEPAPFRFGDNSDDERSENEDDDDLEDLEDEHYLQKLDNSVREQTIKNHHPELMSHNFEEINALTIVTRDEKGVIVDNLHKTNPFLTKYERARILGERARQINEGAKPFVEVKEGIIDGFLIAEEELKLRRIPFIIRRPLSNGVCEYWKLSDLEIL